MSVEDYEWRPVRSSHVAAVGFERIGVVERAAGTHGDARLPDEPFGRLYIAYLNGDVYSFPRVTYDTFTVVSTAKSVGRTLNTLFPNQSGAKKVGSIDPEKLR